MVFLLKQWIGDENKCRTTQYAFHLQLWDVDEMQLHQSIVGHTRNSITAMNVGYGTVFTGSSKGI